MRNPRDHGRPLSARRLALLPRMAGIALISLYQRTLSPDHGPLRHLFRHGVCLHEPTCSEYGKTVIENRGLVIGSWLTFKRILSCNPWSAPSPERIMHISKKS